MRNVVWLLIMFIVAGVAATVLGANDGLVTVYWHGWRTDLSLNLFVFGLVLLCLLVYTTLRGIDSLLRLPQRARLWRTGQRDRAAQAALREALG